MDGAPLNPFLPLNSGRQPPLIINQWRLESSTYSPSLIELCNWLAGCRAPDFLQISPGITIQGIILMAFESVSFALDRWICCLVGLRIGIEKKDTWGPSE